MAGIAEYRKRRDKRNGVSGKLKPVKQTPEEKGNAAAKAKAKAEAEAKAETDEKAKTETVSEAASEPEFDPNLFKND